MHVYLEDSTYAFNLNADEKEHIQYFPNIIESDEDNLDFLKDQRILKILYQDLDIPYLESLEAKVSEDLKEILEISYSSNRYLEFNPKGVSKGLAIKELCEILKIKPSEILSIGDNSNDLSMLKVTGYSAAPSNGVDAVKEEVDYTSIYNYNESAVADIIKHFMNQ